MLKGIAAVVVTHNRKVLLGNCLDALLSQTLPLDMVYVIDNASTDGTSEFLAERGYLRNHLIRYVLLPQNLGGSGGFRNGMEAASRAGYEFLWIMDDDAEPQKDALDRMVPFSLFQDVSAVANLKVDPDGQPQIFHLGMIRWNPFVDLVKPLKSSDYRDKSSLDIGFSSFVGLLIRTHAISKIGLPRKDFYIHADDFEYCVRLNKVGRIVLVPKSVIVHHSPRPSQKRERLLFLTATPDTFKASCFRYFGERNSTWVVKTYSPIGWCGALLWALQHITRRAVKATLFEHDHYWTRLYVLFRGYFDGLTSNFDNAFPDRILNAEKDQQPRELR